MKVVLSWLNIIPLHLFYLNESQCCLCRGYSQVERSSFYIEDNVHEVLLYTRRSTK